MSDDFLRMDEDGDVVNQYGDVVEPPKVNPRAYLKKFFHLFQNNGKKLPTHGGKKSRVLNEEGKKVKEELTEYCKLANKMAKARNEILGTDFCSSVKPIDKHWYDERDRIAREVIPQLGKKMTELEEAIQKKLAAS